MSFSSSSQLHCTRVTLHKNLFTCYIISNIVWILYYSLVATKPNVVASNPVSTRWPFSEYSMTFSVSPVSTWWPLLRRFMYWSTVWHLQWGRDDPFLFSWYCRCGVARCMPWPSISRRVTSSGCSARVCTCTLWSWYPSLLATSCLSSAVSSDGVSAVRE